MHFYFLGYLRFSKSTRILPNLYRCAIENIRSGILGMASTLLLTAWVHREWWTQPSLSRAPPSSRCVESGKLDVSSRMPTTLAIPPSTFWHKNRLENTMAIDHGYRAKVTSFSPSSRRRCCVLLCLTRPHSVILLLSSVLFPIAPQSLHYSAVLHSLYLLFIYHYCKYTVYSVSFKWTRNFIAP